MPAVANMLEGIHYNYHDPLAWLAYRDTLEEMGLPFVLPRLKVMGIEFVLLESGSYLMGSSKSEKDRFENEQQHEVSVSSFYAGVYPVTQAQWQMVMGDNPSHSRSALGATLPVEMVSWHDCQKFCRKLSEMAGRSVRLLTEAEWEYACRAGTTTPYNTGDTITVEQANFWTEGSPRKTTPVGSYSPNAWGLYDMHGNVWEWCQDAYEPYETDGEGEQSPDPIVPSVAARSTSTRRASAHRTFSTIGPTTSAAASASESVSDREGEQSPDPIVSSVAAPAAAARRTSARPFATTIGPSSATATSASESVSDGEGEQSPDPTVPSVAARSTIPRRASALPTATTMRRRTGTTFSASESVSSEGQVLRGGSWFDFGRDCRSALRYRYEPDDWSRVVGFRVAIGL